MLLADDQGANNNVRGYNLKLKKAKGKRAKETIDEAKIPSAVLDDPRFAAISLHETMHWIPLTLNLKGTSCAMLLLCSLLMDNLLSFIKRNDPCTIASFVF